MISGYLITGIINLKMENREFLILEFYEKRVRRIFPALIFTLLGTYAIGWFLLLPEELKQLGKHVAGGATFSSNLIYWSESGYFDADSTSKILLHLWSLGVEEQFYLFWPIFLLVASRLNLDLRKLILILFVASFSWNIYEAQHDPVGDFYSPFTRLWELGVGGFISLHRFDTNKKSKSITILSIVAAFFLMLAIFRTLEHYKYPGWWALFPTISTAVLISSRNSWVNRHVLSWRPLVFVGLISFPLYLWHWPVLTLLRIYWGGEPNQGAKVFAFALSLGLAWTTYRYVEKPLRQVSVVRGLAFSQMAAKLVAMTMIIGGVGFICYWQNGYEERYPTIARMNKEDSFAAVFNELRTTTFDCVPNSLRKISYQYDGTSIVRCRQTKNEGNNQTLALIGDSHAEHLFYGLTKQIPKNENLVYFTFSCLPFSGLVRLGKEDCNRMGLALDHIVATQSISAVILSSYWADRSNEDDIRLRTEIDNNDLDHVFITGLDRTLGILEAAHKRVIFAFDVPDLDFSPVDCLRRFSLTNRKCEIAKLQGTRSSERYKVLVEKVLEAHPNVIRWDPTSEICGVEICPIFQDGHMLYLDKHHLSGYGSRKVAKSLASLID